MAKIKELVALCRKYWRWIVFVPFGLILAMQIYFFFQIAWWVHFNPSSTSFMRQQLSVLQEKNPKAKLQHKWVPYKRISRNLKRAVIASEDSNFTDHEGVEWEALLKAYEKTARKEKLLPVVLLSHNSWPKISFFPAVAVMREKFRNLLLPTCSSSGWRRSGYSSFT